MRISVSGLYKESLISEKSDQGISFNKKKGNDMQQLQMRMTIKGPKIHKGRKPSKAFFALQYAYGASLSGWDNEMIGVSVLFGTKV